MSRPRTPEEDAARGEYPAAGKLHSGALPMVAAQGGAWSHVEPEVWTDVERKTLGLRLYVERENQRAQGTYLALGMQQCHYRMYERAFIELAQG